MSKPIIGITMGDPAGNGPEITVKALAHAELYDRCRPIVVGDAAMIEQAARFVGRPDIRIHRCAAVSDDGDRSLPAVPGTTFPSRSQRIMFSGARSP